MEGSASHIFTFSDLISISAHKILVINGSANYDGVIFVTGFPLNRFYYFADVTCTKSSAKGLGDCFYLSNTDILITNLRMISIDSINSLINIEGNTVTYFQLENTILLNCHISNSFLRAMYSRLKIKKFSCKDIGSTSLTRFFVFEKSMLIFSDSQSFFTSRNHLIVYLSAVDSNLECTRNKLVLDHSGLAFLLNKCEIFLLNLTEIYQGK